MSGAAEPTRAIRTGTDGLSVVVIRGACILAPRAETIDTRYTASAIKCPLTGLTWGYWVDAFALVEFALTCQETMADEKSDVNLVVLSRSPEAHVGENPVPAPSSE